MTHAWGGKFKMLGSINVLIRRILMTPGVSTVTYTKNADLSVKQTVKQIVRIDIRI